MRDLRIPESAVRAKIRRAAILSWVNKGRSRPLVHTGASSFLVLTSLRHDFSEGPDVVTPSFSSAFRVIFRSFGSYGETRLLLESLKQGILKES